MPLPHMLWGDETYYIFWGKISSSLAIGHETTRIKLKSKVLMRPFRSPLSLWVVEDGTFETVHLRSLLVVPPKGPSLHPKLIVTPSLPHRPPFLSQTPGPLSYGLSLSQT